MMVVCICHVFGPSVFYATSRFDADSAVSFCLDVALYLAFKVLSLHFFSSVLFASLCFDV